MKAVANDRHFGKFLRWNIDRRGGTGVVAQRAEVTQTTIWRWQRFNTPDEAQASISPPNRHSLAVALQFESWQAICADFEVADPSKYATAGPLRRDQRSLRERVLKLIHAEASRRGETVGRVAAELVHDLQNVADVKKSAKSKMKMAASSKSGA